jgi:tetratricopeptide (TPR) repeat protein
MAKKRTVFLSSTGADLVDYRKAVMDRLRISDHVHVDGMEIFGARDSNSEDLCRQRVVGCDIYVGLIGHYRGNDVFGDNRQRSYTELEYTVAIESGKPRLMYIVPDDFRPPAPSQTKKAERRQAAFRKMVLAGRVVSFEFGTPDRLAAAVAVDLMNLVVDLIATDLAASRDTPASPGQQQAVVEAVAAVVESAEQGDDRMARALALLEEKKIEEAAQLLRAVAEEKTAQVEQDRDRIAQDSKLAAAAWRHLGAIAGLADPKRALDSYLKAAELDPGDILSQFWVGWIQLERGPLDEAAQRFDRVVALAGDGHGWPRYWAELGQGDIAIAHGDLEKALRQYRACHEMADRRAKAEPGNAGRQFDLGISNERIGDVLMTQGDLANALKSHETRQSIIDRLAKADPDNTSWQRDLSVSYEKVGDVLVKQAKFDQAFTSFRDSLAIRERLAKAEAGNAGWQRDLSVSYNKVGDVLVAQGKLDQALTSFRDSLAIRDRLARADPGNATWQRDLSVSHTKMGGVLVRLQKAVEALTHYRIDLAIAEKLALMDSSNARWRDDLVISHQQIVAVLRKIGMSKLSAEQKAWLKESEAKLAALAKQ